MNVRLIAITKPAIPECETAEELIAYTARVSNPGNQANMETAPRLLAYLQRKRHWSPFQMAHMVVEVHTTRDIAHQIVRHASFAFQEFSQRYAEVTVPLIFSTARLQDTTNRQSSIETDDAALQSWWFDAQSEVAEVTTKVYRQALQRGIAKELARKVLPEGMTPTTLYVTGSVRSFIHYCDSRTDPSTQKEHREVALAIEVILLEQFSALTYS